MDFIKNFQPTPMNLLKLGGVLIAALLVLAIAAQIFAPRFPLSMTPGMPAGITIGGMAVIDSADSYSTAGYAGGGENAYYTMKEEGYNGSVTLSARNAMAPTPSSIDMPIMPPVTPSPNTGADAEKFEVTDYSASIETRKLEQTCGKFADLKAKEYVIFDNSNAYDRGCSFTFKVEAAHVAEVLAWVKDLGPKYLNESTYTIKDQVDDYTSEEEILKKKLTEIDNTLKSATTAYDEVTRLATQTRDAQSLASIISSRLDIIQRLTQERLYINEQLDRLARSKSDQMDRLDYTYFRVDVTENTFVDTRMIKESWKQALRDVVRVINDAVQGVTINLIALFFILLQWTLYALILLVIAKYGWMFAKKIWNS